MQCAATGRVRALGLAVLILVTPACDALSGPGGDGELDDVLFGEWIAVADVITGAGSAGQQVDAIRDLGGFLALTFQPDGTVAVAELEGGEDALWTETGTWSADGATLTVHWESESSAEDVTYEIDGAGRLRVEIPATEYDFDDDGADEPAAEALTFVASDQASDPALEGIWHATRYVFTDAADPQASHDMLADSATFEIWFDGTSVSWTLQVPAEGGGTNGFGSQGLHYAVDGLLWILEDGDYALPTLYFYDSDGAVANVTGPWEAYDFDGDGTDEPATLALTLAHD